MTGEIKEASKYHFVRFKNKEGGPMTRIPIKAFEAEITGFPKYVYVEKRDSQPLYQNFEKPVYAELCVRNSEWRGHHVISKITPQGKRLLKVEFTPIKSL